MVAMKPFLFSRYTRIHMRATHLHFPHTALPLPGQRVAWCPTAACVVVDTIEPTTHTQTQNTQNSSPPRDGYTDTHTTHGTGENFALGPKRMDGEMRSLTTVHRGGLYTGGGFAFAASLRSGICCDSAQLLLRLMSSSIADVSPRYSTLWYCTNIKKVLENF